MTPVQFFFTSGVRDITVSSGATLTLAPGAYRNLRMGSRATLNLRSGVYKFRYILVDADSKINFDLTSGPVRVDVVEDVEFHERVKMALTGGAAGTSSSGCRARK